MKLAVVQEAFLEDLRARALRQSTLNGYLAVFRLWLAKAEAEGRAELEDWDAAALRAWRNGWACSPGTHGLRLSKLKAFFRFAVDEGWLAASPAKRLRPPRNDARPTLPLTLAERRALVLAASSVSGSVRAFVLLRRYSGLAIQDTATLARERLEGTLLTLRRGKSGELVQVDLPDVVVEALAAVPREGPHYFWTGKSQPVTAAKLWARRLTAVGKQAQIAKFRSHRLRDTFAAELLLAGVALEDVSIPPGACQRPNHGAALRAADPWIRSRRDRLVRIVREAHGRDPLLKALRPKNKELGGVAPPPSR